MSAVGERASARFYVRKDGEGLVRRDAAGFAYLRAYGWVKFSLRRGRRLVVDVASCADSEEAEWVSCSEESAREHALRFFNGEELHASVVGRRRRLVAYLVNHDLLPRARLVPHGPSPWLVSRALQEEAQRQEVNRIESLGHAGKARMGEWLEQARKGYEQEQSRIDGIQKRASFILGATGITTAGVLANGGLILGGDTTLSSGAQLAVAVMLMLATLALAFAVYAALETTMIMFELAQPNAPWQVERRMKALRRKEEPEYELAATLLAARRAEVIGDWKVQRLRRARRSFALAIAFLVFANLAAIVGAQLA